MKTYKINEIFYSIQGEGFHAGTPAVFVRFSGCNLQCPFCDTPHQTGCLYTATDVIGVVERITPEDPRLIVLTGGEPLLQVDIDLLHLLLQRFLHCIVAIETNGTINPHVERLVPRERRRLWITCSPKLLPLQLPTCDTNEFKVVHPGTVAPQVVDERCARLVGVYSDRYAPLRFLQPCTDKDPVVTQNNIDRAVAFVKQNKGWRLSLQTQKMARFP